MANTKKEILARTGDMDEEERLEALTEDDQRVENALEAESRLLTAFSDFMHKLKSIKYLVGPSMGIPYGHYEQDSLRDAVKNRKWSLALRRRLRKKALAKMDVLYKMIDEVFGPTEAEEEEKAEYKRDQEEAPVRSEPSSEMKARAEY